jgi:hypothetical protein
MPSSPNYKRDFKQEMKTDKARGGIKKREERNLARAEMMREGKVHKGDGQDVDHIKPLDKGGSPGKQNLRVVSAGENRSFSRDSKGSLKSQTSKRERRK